MLVAGLVGITLSVPLQAPAVIFLGFAAIFAAAQVVKSGSAGVRKFANQELQNSSTTKLPNSKTSIAWLLGLVLVSVGYFVVRACLSPVWDLGVEDLMLIVSAGILYLTAGYAVTGKSGILLRQGLAWVVVVLLLLHVGAAVMQLNGEEGYSLSYYFTGVARSSPENVTGMYSYYGSFANFAVIAGLLCLSLGVWGRLSVMLRVMMCILGVVALALALWSQSRSAALSLIPALVVFGVLLLVSLAQHSARVRRRASKVMVSLGVCGLLAGGVAAAWVFQNRAHDEQVSGVDVVFDSGVRSQYWAMAGDQWADFPIVGAGSRSFSYECFRYWSPNLPTQNANPEFVHNEYLQLLADYGLVGLLLILVLFGWHFYRGGKQVRSLAVKIGEGGLKRGSNAMALAIAGMSGMTAMAVHICFDFRTHLLANLLLLVSCAVWILPVAKSTVSLSGGPGVKESKMGSFLLGLVLLAAGLGAVGLGCQQLWAGMPLVKNKMAKEDGAWQPATVNRDIWIPALEESLARAPQWRRYQRLGTLYRIDADSLEGDAKDGAIDRAITAYLSSIDRHSHNPIPWINLAGIFTAEEQFELADDAYANAAELAKARERWFRMHSRWATLHQQWAVALWREGDNYLAEQRFLRAKELFKLSYGYAEFYQNKQWVVEYTQLLIAFARFLDHQRRYEEADTVFRECRDQVNWYNWQRDTKLNFYRGLHLYEHGRHLWYQRKPQEAYQLMLKARVQLIQHRSMMKDDVENEFSRHLAKVEEVLKFFKKTGVGD